MPYANNITQKVQQAAAAYLTAAVAANTLTEVTNVYEGIRLGAKEFPCVICQCKRAVVEEPWDGNWSADLVVIVESLANDTTEDQHYERAGNAFSLFMLAKENVGIELTNALADFTVQLARPVSQDIDLIVEGSEEEQTDKFRSELVLTLTGVCDSDIA